MMCKFCQNYDFSRIGFDFDYDEKLPSIYFAGGSGKAPENERFKFCPVCGERLTEENFKE